MNPPNEPSRLEPVPVQLTRIEGSVNLIVERVGNLQGQISEIKSKVETHDARLTAVEIVQATGRGASDSWRSWLPTILTALALMAALGFGIKFGG